MLIICYHCKTDFFIYFLISSITHSRRKHITHTNKTHTMKWEEDEEGHGEKKRKRRLVAKALRSLLMCNEF